MTDLTIVFWLWRDLECRNQYTVDHVNHAARMIDKHLTLPHHHVLFVDNHYDLHRLDSAISPHPLWKNFHLLKHPNPRWRRSYPQCYVRLRIFSAEDYIHDIVGDRFASIDLDFIACSNLDDVFSRTDPFLIVKSPDNPPRGPFNGSMFLMDFGCRPRVWTEFSEDALRCMPQEVRYIITDQGWMQWILGDDELGWGPEDGVYLWPWLVKNHKLVKEQVVPEGAKLVFFNGIDKPWHSQHLQWAKKYWETI